VSNSAHPDTIDGSKNFQPTNETHVVIAFHVVCADARGADAMARCDRPHALYATHGGASIHAPFDEAQGIAALAEPELRLPL